MSLLISVQKYSFFHSCTVSTIIIFEKLQDKQLKNKSFIPQNKVITFEKELLHFVHTNNHA